MKKIVFLAISCLLITLLGVVVTGGYVDNHDYYMQMLGVAINWNTLFLGLLGASIPTWYIIFSKKSSLGRLFLSIVAGAYLYLLTFIGMNGELHGLGFLKLLLNCFILLGLGCGFSGIVTVLGGVIKEKLLALKTENVFDLTINFGIGLVTFLSINYIFILSNTFFSLVSWIVLIGMGFLVYLERERASDYASIVTNLIDTFHKKHFHKSRLLLLGIPLIIWGIFGNFAQGGSISLVLGLIGLVIVGSYLYGGVTKGDWRHEHPHRSLWRTVVAFLLLISFWYIFNGFNLSLMPYSTAWDANHAYMFLPKMHAFHNGIYWNEVAMSGFPDFWSIFISFWFSLFKPFGGFFGIATDTFAIEMNFFSGIYVLILGITLIDSIIEYFSSLVGGISTQNKRLGIATGWILILLWLSSGMGAFLVFIDNKTDLGVLTLIILAILSGFLFLSKITDLENIDSKIRKYVGLSGLFYGVAVLSKPTAFFDVLNFGLFLGGVWFSSILVLGGFLVVVGLLVAINFRGIKDYIPNSYSAGLLAVGGILSFFGLGKGITKNIGVKLRIAALWIGIMLLTIVLVKVPYKIIHGIVYDSWQSPGKFIQSVLLSNAKPVDKDIVLLASTQPIKTREQCTLESQGFTSKEDLYAGVVAAKGSAYDEDVGRYVGFGWKGNDGDVRRGITPFVNPFWGGFFSDGCYGFNPFFGNTQNAKILCENEAAVNDVDIQKLESVYASLIPGLEKDILGALIDSNKKEPSSLSDDERKSKYSRERQDLIKMMQDNSMQVKTIEGQQFIKLPYKFLVFQNMTYNWSIQNKSSYYTDIGMIWLILLPFIGIALLYGLFIKRKELVVLSGVTVSGWFLWSVVGGGILRYGIGIIIWTIITFVIYLILLFDSNDDNTDESGTKVMFSYIFVGIFILVSLIQLGFNMIRISSHSLRAGGIFMQYKTNWGYQTTFDDKLQKSQKLTGLLGLEDVFKSQFAHYNTFLDNANSRDPGEGVWIAGTYARYFVEDQQNVKYDQFVMRLNVQFSGSDPCTTYLRLKDQNMRYFAIDPNIGTVVSGDGNKSLFYRFFGKINTVSGEIEEDGAFTMFTKMVDAGYMRLVSSSNLGAKYAQILPESSFAKIPEKDRTVFKARMSVGRYFGKQGDNEFVRVATDIAEQRMADGMFVTDIAEILGLRIRENHLVNLVKQGSLSQSDISELSTDERSALSQFLSLRYLNQNNKDEYKKTLQSIIEKSIFSPNQIIVFELVQ